MEYIRTIIDFLPHVVWAAIISSMITWFGVFLQNRGETKRNKLRLEHDAKQRDNEREMNLRREVYLGAAEALGNAFRYLASFADTNINPQEHLKMIQDMPAAFNKIHMIATLETIWAISKANSFFARSNLDLHLQKLPITILSQEIQNLQKIINGQENYRNHLFISMDQWSKSAMHEPNLFLSLNRDLDKVQQEINGNHSRMAVMNRKLFQLQVELAEKSATATREYGKLFVDANIAVRKELNLPLDEEKYSDLRKREDEKMQSEMQGFLERIKKDTESGLLTPEKIIERG